MASSINSESLLRILVPFQRKNNFKAALIFVMDYLIYFGLFALIIAFDNVALKLLLAIPLGLSIGLIFIVGHDCCHNSFTNSRTLNRLLGILSFVPSAHNFTLWDLGHNKTHHAFTNLKDEDYVFCPLSREEFGELSLLKRIVYRIYRSTVGHGLYYGIEIWFKKMILPHNNLTNSKRLNFRQAYLDSVPFILFYAALILLVCYFAESKYVLFWNLLCSIIIPFLFWNFAMGFVIYQHHTGLNVKWFNSREDWEYWEAQIEQSVHVVFPKPLNTVLHNIMEHTAHHLNMQIPLYNLPRAQKALEDKFTTEVNLINWNLKYYFDTVNNCKLYDFDNHKWERF